MEIIVFVVKFLKHLESVKSISQQVYLNVIQYSNPKIEN